MMSYQIFQKLKCSDLKFRNKVKHFEEDQVYPLSIKYDKRKTIRINLYKYFFLIVIIVLLIPFDLYSLSETKTSKQRVGYFADRIYTDSISISGATEINLSIKNWVIYILENTINSNFVDLYMSASRSTTFSASKSGTAQNINIVSDSGVVQCYVEMKIPGGVTIPKLTFTFDGDTIEDLQIYDYKDNSKWTTPMIITNLVFTISNAYPNVMFQNPHQVSSLTVSGSFCNCNFDYLKIASMTFTVNVGSLSILQNSVYTQNSITVKTPHGTHCIAGATVNTVDSNWPSQATRNAGISGTYVDTSTYCQSILYVCSSLAASCPSSGTAVTSGQGSFTITLDDGPVQFLIDGSTTGSSVTYNPTFDSFSITSQIKLSSEKTDFSTYPNDPRIYLYEIISPQYKRMWVHSSLRQYIEARPWMISLLSLNILTPSYIRSRLIHIPSSTWPTTFANNSKKNTLISSKLTSLVYTESIHFVGQAANNTYYEFEYTEKGDYIQTEISMFSGSTFILLSFIVSCVISLFSVLAMYVFLWRINKIFVKLYHKYLESNRKLSKFKREVDDQNNEHKTFTEYSRKSIFAFKILKLGLFSSNIENKNLDGNNSQNEIKIMLRKKKKSSISFFKVPELYIDYLRRINANSFRMFLNSIYESDVHFTEYKLSSDQCYMEVSTRIDLLNNKYIEYWTKEGLRPRQIKEEERILKEFNLELEFKSDSSTDSYSYIKWKTFDEKLSKIKAEYINKKDNKMKNIEELKNPLIEFLNSECIKSSFKSDFILVSDLIEKYNQFCRDHKVPDISKQKIIDSPELKEFGAEFNPRYVVPFIKGISFKRIFVAKNESNENNSSYLEDIVRIPKELSYKTAKMGWCRKIKQKLGYFALSEEGIVTNLAIVIIHLAIIIGVPLLILIAVTWTLIQIDTINQDIYAYVFKFKNIFNSSSYNFWFDHMTGKAYFFTVAGLGWFFFISGLLELVWYYATGARDTGKYIVTKTWPRWIISTTFWIIIIVFIGIYTAYISMMLVWCILGAILNPQKFLPMAAGAVVVIGFCTMIYSKLKQIDDTLKEVVSTTINLALKNSINENFEKEKLKLTQLVMKPLTGFTQRMFYIGVNASVKEFNLPPIEKELTDSVLEGDAGAVAMLFNKTCGVNKNVSLWLIGLLLNDQTLILNSIYDLSEEIGFDSELSVAITEIAINLYNNSSVDIKQVEYSVVISVKKLFRKLMPDFPQDIIDTILQVALEADPYPLKELWQKMNVSENVFSLLTALVTNNYGIVDESLYNLSQNIIPLQYKYIFDTLYTISKGDVSKEFAPFFENSLNLRGLSLLIKIIIAAAKKDPELVKEILYNFDTSLPSVANSLGINVHPQSFIELKNDLLVFYQIIRGDVLKIEDLVIKHIPEEDPSIVNTLHLASTKNMKCFDKIIDCLGLSIQKNKILEFFSIITSEYSRLSVIGQRLGIYEDHTELLRALITFIVTTSNFFIKTKPKLESVSQVDFKEQIKYEEEIIKFKEVLEKWLDWMIEIGAIKIKSVKEKLNTQNIELLTKRARDEVDDSIHQDKIKDAQQLTSNIEKFKTNVIKKVSSNQNIF